MEFLGVGPMELAFIILIAMVLIGPRDIAKTARAAGRFLNRMYRSEAWKTLNEASQNLRTLPNRLAREAELDELKEVKQTLDQTRAALTGAKPAPDGLQSWQNPSTPRALGPAPMTSPPPKPTPAEGMRAWTEVSSPPDSGAARPAASPPPDKV